MSDFSADFRQGDRHVDIGGTRTRLRLSVSALAEIASTLKAKSPSKLAQRLRGAGEGEWNLILCALASPRPSEGLGKDELTEILPTLTAVIAEGLGA